MDPGYPVTNRAEMANSSLKNIPDSPSSFPLLRLPRELYLMVLEAACPQRIIDVKLMTIDLESCGLTVSARDPVPALLHVCTRLRLDIMHDGGFLEFCDGGHRAVFFRPDYDMLFFKRVDCSRYLRKPVRVFDILYLRHYTASQDLQKPSISPSKVKDSAKEVIRHVGIECLGMSMYLDGDSRYRWRPLAADLRALFPTLRSVTFGQPQEPRLESKPDELPETGASAVPSAVLLDQHGPRKYAPIQRGALRAKFKEEWEQRAEEERRAAERERTYGLLRGEGGTGNMPTIELRDCWPEEGIPIGK